MPQVSRNKLDKKDQEKILKTLHLILASISNTEKMQDFILSFLTPTEQLMLAKRLAIVILLKEGLDEAEISNALNVTKPTVAKLRYFVEARGKGYEIVYGILKNEKISKEITNALSSIGKYLVKHSYGRGNPTTF